MPEIGDVENLRMVQEFRVMFDRPDDRDDFIIWYWEKKDSIPDFLDAYVLPDSPDRDRFSVCVITDHIRLEQAQEAVEELVEEWEAQREEEATA